MAGTLSVTLSVTGIGTGTPNLADILKNGGGLGDDRQKQQEDEQEEMRRKRLARAQGNTNTATANSPLARLMMMSGKVY